MMVFSLKYQYSANAELAFRMASVPLQLARGGTGRPPQLTAAPTELASLLASGPAWAQAFAGPILLWRQLGQF